MVFLDSIILGYDFKHTFVQDKVVLKMPNGEYKVYRLIMFRKIIHLILLSVLSSVH